MKLYATVTSERATKGQGGNLFTHAKMTIEEVEVLAAMIDKSNFLYLKMKGLPDKCFCYEKGTWIDVSGIGQSKGNKQKDEMKLDPCPECGSTMVHTHE